MLFGGGSEVDIKVFENLNTDLPEGSTMLADKGYPDYDHENLLGETGLHLKAQRKKYLKRPMSAWGVFRQADPPVRGNGLRPDDHLIP